MSVIAFHVDFSRIKELSWTSIALIRKTSLQSCKNDIDLSFVRKMRDSRYRLSTDSCVSMT